MSIIDVLKKHRDNLTEATTFEEYKKAHIAYIDYLIARNTKRQEIDNTISVLLEELDQIPWE